MARGGYRYRDSFSVQLRQLARKWWLCGWLAKAESDKIWLVAWDSLVKFSFYSFTQAPSPNKRPGTHVPGQAKS